MGADGVFHDSADRAGHNYESACIDRQGAGSAGGHHWVATGEFPHACSAGVAASWQPVPNPYEQFANYPSKLGQLVVTLVSGLVQTAWRTAQTIFLTIISGIGQFASNILQKLRSGLSTVWSVITSPFSKAKETLDGIVAKIKGFFPIHFGKIFDGLKLPHFNVKGGEFPYGVAGKGSLPSFSIDWYKKAETQPYMFTDATLFGAGEHNDEILYGRNQLLKDIAQATNGGDAFTINVYGTAGMDVNELADAVERRIIEIQNRRRLAWQ